MRFSSRFFKMVLVASVVALVAGCQKKVEKPIDYSSITYKRLSPASFKADSSKNAEIPSLERRYDYRYAIMLGDTLGVSVLEFESDVYALDYYMNSGHFQGSIPILRGNFLEQSFRADKRIFIFRHDSYRRYERADLEDYVRKFPGYHGGFPQAFLSLPFEHREQGRASIETRFFMGVKSTFPVLVQSYRDGNLRWNVARSWDQVESDAFETWASGLKQVTPNEIVTANDCVYFEAGEGSYGIASRLSGGRVAVVWGYMSWPDLERTFFTASDRIFEARF
ncbi:hypothetical protein [Fibrobacter sp. UWB10]|uniref:hypothetical protein n=1 Tax=Fibrobacter sp. UWB10 TaxID=1896201 RepID=UPI00156BAEF4|nr:hypothetical protein [Fibrobacter sp. UWB10]SMP46039.1 hypothetical protein SAMN05720465_1167 [Fibrobacter sp. UWB10]